jgi:hypothetical protein
MKKRSKPWEEIVEKTVARQTEDDPLKRRMIDVRDRYNGAADGFIIPVDSDLEQEQLDPLIPTLVSEAIDQHALRAGSGVPGIVCPPLRPGKPAGVGSREYAQIREKALYETYEQSRFNLGMRRMYRHLGGYASMSAAVMEDRRLGMPRIKVMDPLSSYPEPRAPEDLSDPQDCAFIFGKSSEWIRANYPKTRRENGGPIGEVTSSYDQMWDVAWWVDDFEWVFGLIGIRNSTRTAERDVRGTHFMEFDRWEHGLDHAPFIAPNKVTMDRIISQIANVTGLIDLKARLMRLQLAAAEKAVFPDKYILGDETQAVIVNDGDNKWKDGRNGDVNVVLGARGVGNLSGTPDQSAMQVADRFERDFRISTGLVPQTGGESYGALRTGRGIDALMAEAVDPRVKESQEIMEAHLPRINSYVLEMFEKHREYRSKTYILFPGYAGDTDAVEFVPKTHVEGHYLNRVRYSITGAGVEATNIVVQQMVAAELISRDTAREMHPYVRGNNEGAKINVEKLAEAVMQGLLQGTMSGTIPPIMAAFVADAQAKNPEKDIFFALEEADAKMRQQQAEQVPPDDPAAQPGIAPGAPAGPASAPQELPPGIGPTSGMEGLRELNNAIASSARVVA